MKITKEANRSEQGVALVIVLGFVVMLLVLLLAFFSQSILNRQISAASSNQALAEAFAQGAVSTTVADLVDEIAAGSNATTNVTGPVTNTLYFPKAASNAVPSLSGSTGTNGLENLVKRSSSTNAFFPGGTSRAAASSTTNASSNGRAISAARWNKPLLMPVTSTNNWAPPPSAGFAAPDWIFVARDGSNPTAWSDSLRWSATNAPTVIGRYAFAIYDEGGVLDANVAGYPQALGNATDSPVPYKSALAFADLTQIGLNQTQIHALVGWRNYATAAAAGNFPSYTFPDGGSIYGRSVLGNTNGFLKAANSSLNSGRTDRKFTSRQELISFLLAADPAGRAGAIDALRYLATFTRSIEQPSFAPPASRPGVLPRSGGGNYAGDFPGADSAINPSFLTVRVQTTTAGGRSDGADLTQGEPLVKKRFPLNRLAWLTHKGPIADDSGNLSTDAEVQTVIAALRNAGLSDAFLKLGGPANIEKSFGLTWSVGKWSYRKGSNAPIKALSGITGREADFFELLKASVCLGSTGKAYSYTASPAATTPDGYNEQRDNSPDAQIMQMGANIIDQADVDGYPTVIVFNDGSLFGGRDLEYAGVEDLPYIYRVREGKVMTRDSNPPQSLLPQVGGTLSDTGEGQYMLQPEIWNPHAMEASTAAGPCPTNFRLVAATADPVSNTPMSYRIGVRWRPDSGTDLIGPTTPALASSPLTLNATMTFNIPSNRQDLFREPTLLIKPDVPAGSNLAGPATYTLGPSSVFTAAYQYGANNIPDNLRYTGIPVATVPMAFTATIPVGGITGGGVLPTSASTGICPTGFLYYPTSGNSGSFPYVTYRLQCQTAAGWVTYDQKYAVAPTASSFDTPGRWGGGNTPGNVNFTYNCNKTFYRLVSQPWSMCAMGSQGAVGAFDPRTSRFGMLITGSNGRTANGQSIPLSSSVRYWEDGRTPWNQFGWAGVPTSSTSSVQSASAAQNAVMTARPEEAQGAVFSNGSQPNSFGYNTGPTASGWAPGGNTSMIAPGLTAQNNPNIGAYSSLKRYALDQQTPNNTTPQYFADADGVVRRGMSAYVPFSGSDPAVAPSAGKPSGLPLKSAYQYAGGVASPSSSNEYLSRPVVLNRPFRSVSELGYVFSGTPWRNLDCSTPESGAAALLDVFCVADGADQNALVAGRLNLNTRQRLVLQALLSGAYKDESNSGLAPAIDSSLAPLLSAALVARTASTASSQGPLMNLSDLVGKWHSSQSVGSAINGSRSYVGFTSDTVSSANDLTTVLDPSGTGTSDQRIARFREAAIRPLASAGQTRVWNLMIDLVAQVGRFSQSSSSLGQFIVESEQRCWVHIAIDRLTGRVVDQQIELVKE